MKYFLFFTYLFLFIACTEKIETIVTEVPVLRASDIYRGDSVYQYMNKYKDENKLIADSYLEKGKKETLNPEKAIYFFKRAVTLNPTLINYKILAEALTKAGKYNELSGLYYMLTNKQYVTIEDQKNTPIYLFGPPDENLNYERVITSMLINGSLSSEHLYLSQELGFDNSKIKSKLLSDKRIHLDTASAYYKNMMLQFEDYETLASYAKRPIVFKDFLATIHDSSADFEIDEKVVQQFNYDDFNGINFNEYSITFNEVYKHYLQETEENKNTWVNFNFSHKIPINTSITAVVYAIDSSADACPKEMRHIYHRLVTYDNNTISIIDSKIIAVQSGTQLQTAHFKNGKVTIERYERIWNKPYEKRNFDNDLIKTEKVGESNYEIQPDGTIKETSSLVSANQ